jgi:hypothetical protein
MGNEVPADSLGDEWAGYVLRITGGNDKQVGDRIESSCWNGTGDVKRTGRRLAGQQATGCWTRTERCLNWGLIASRLRVSQ